MKKINKHINSQIFILKFRLKMMRYNFELEEVS